MYEGTDFVTGIAWAYSNDLFVYDKLGILSRSELIADYDFDRMNELADLSG